MTIQLQICLFQTSTTNGSGFSISLSQWSFTKCPTSYNHKYNVLSVLLNKTFFIPNKFSIVSSSIDNPFEVMDKCNKFKYSKLSSNKNEMLT